MPAHASPLPFKSAITGIAWPAIPTPQGAALLALLEQLEQSQWWDAETLRAWQFRQLDLLLEHALETVPYYRERAAAYRPALGGGPAAWEALPILTRRTLQEEGGRLASERMPPEHGELLQGQSSGSTGTPVHFRGSGLTRLFWHAFTLREHLWHGRDFSGRLAAIRQVPAAGEAASWGAATEAVLATGPSAGLPIQTPVAVQAEWLIRQDPDYLLSYATNLHALARHFIERGRRLPRLREVRSIGETVTPELREAVRAAWGVPLTDVYSAQEVGTIALQCPTGAHYHVQAEGLLVEVLDDASRPCAPGATGRVVLTDLHNFAMPFIRYDIGDYAEAGAPCACGRGLPVLNRVMGRSRNMAVFPDGSRRWPLLGGQHYADLAPVRQFQIVQRSLEEVEARLVVARPLDAGEEGALRGALTAALGHSFAIRFVYLDEIARGPGGKFEDFISEVTG